ncbi:MAG: HupE/UreJ family protein [Candidatus Polarisedimenticolia bacterium]
MTRRPWVAAAVLAAVAWSLTGTARAHDMPSAFVQLHEGSDGTWEIIWRVPALRGMRLKLDLVLPDACQEVAPRAVEPAAMADGSMHAERWKVRCDGGLEGKEIRIQGLATTLTDVVGRIVRADGRTQTTRVLPMNPVLVVAPEASALQKVGAFVGLGITHIVMGVDHLLFVLGLLLIVPDRWVLLKTITAFTVAHSVTLAVATLGYASAPTVPLNAAIALSILFLGPEVVRARAGRTSLTIRHPWVVAFVFGLLHGFGFASGLTTLGLPPSEIPLALLLFNVGVEAGQVLFIAMVILMERSFAVLQMRWPRWVEALPGYAVGSLGAFWTIQRTAILLRGLV